MSAEKLYTPDMLAAAVSLADFLPIADAQLKGEARSATCGSTLAMDLRTSASGQIEAIGMKVSACAVGQASAAIFARHAKGSTLAEISRAFGDMQAWLESEGPTPDWPEIALIVPARDYPARHGAILLPWKAALAALSTAPASS